MVTVVHPRIARRLGVRRRSKGLRWLWAIHITVGVVTVFAGLSCAGVFPDDGPLKFLSFAERWFVMEPQLEPSIVEPLPPSTATATPSAASEQTATQAQAATPEASEARVAVVAAEPKAQGKAAVTTAAVKAEPEAGSKASALVTTSAPKKRARSARAPKRSTTASTPASRPTSKRDAEMEAAAALLVKAMGERTLEKPTALE